MGTIGTQRVVSTKLSRKGQGENADIASENTVTRLLGMMICSFENLVKVMCRS